MQKALEVYENLVLEDENVLVLVFLFHFECHILLEHLVVGFIDKT